MKRVFTLVALAVLLLAVTARLPPTIPSNASAAAISDPTIVQKLQEIVTIRQKLVEGNKLLAEVGKGDTEGRFEIALAEARFELARELNQRNEQIAALQEALEVQRRRLEMVKESAALGVVTQVYVETVRAAVLEAEVRLLRERSR